MIELDTSDCAILADRGAAGRHARGVVVASLRKSGQTSLAIVDREDGMLAVVVRLDGRHVLIGG